MASPQNEIRGKDAASEPKVANALLLKSLASFAPASATILPQTINGQSCWPL